MKRNVLNKFLAIVCVFTAAAVSTLLVGCVDPGNDGTQTKEINWSIGTNLPTATYGTGYSANVGGATAPGGTTVQYTCGNLPIGLYLNQSSGQISGVAMVIAGQTYTFDITATAGNLTITKRFSLYIDRKPVSKPTLALPNTFTYDGQTHEVVLSPTSDAYSISNNIASAVGTYYARVQLAPNYKWTNGTTGSFTLAWSITGAGGGPPVGPEEPPVDTTIFIQNAPNTLDGLTSYGQTLSEIVVPDGVEIIREFAFRQNNNIVSITVPEGLRTIEDWAIDYLPNLEHINFPESIEMIRNSTDGQNYMNFNNCPKLHVTWTFNPTYWAKPYAYKFQNIWLNVVFPNTVTEVPEHAFDTFGGYPQLESVVFSPNTTTINRYAFAGCTNFTNFVVPDTVTSINADAFSGCTGLVTATLGTGITFIPDGLFSSCSNLETIIIRGAVTQISQYAFRSCAKLANMGPSAGAQGLNVPTSVTTIGKWAFYGCNLITTVTFYQESITIDDPFYGCSALTRVEFRGSANIRGGFQSCAALEIVIFANNPYRLQFTSERIFQNCPSLRSIVLPTRLIQNWDICTGVFRDLAPFTLDVYFYGADQTAWETFKERVSPMYDHNTAIFFPANVYFYSATPQGNGGIATHWRMMEINGENVPALWE